jgi:hypothetical protein
VTNSGLTHTCQDATSSHSQSISLPPTSPSHSVTALTNNEVESSPAASAQRSSLEPAGHQHSVSSPPPPSSVSISGSNASFTDQSSESGSSPPYLHSPPGSPSVSPFRRPLRVERSSAGKSPVVPFKVDDSPHPEGQSEDVLAQESVNAPESTEPPKEPKKTKAQLWNEIKVKCRLPRRQTRARD